MKPLVVAIAACILCSCASTGVIPIGQDTFMIADKASNGYVSVGSVKAGIYREANTFCASRNQEFQPVRESSADGTPNSWEWAKAELHFRCLNKGDPELGRTNMKPVADIKIENIHRTSSPAAPSGDLYADLTKLKALLDDNIITQAEFDIQKKALLDKYK